MILPTKRHISSISKLSGEEVEDLAKVISGVSTRMDNLFVIPRWRLKMKTDHLAGIDSIVHLVIRWGSIKLLFIEMRRRVR